MLRTNALRRGAGLAALVLVALAARSLAVSSDLEQQQGLSMAAANSNADANAPTSTSSSTSSSSSSITDRRFTPLLPEEPGDAPRTTDKNKNKSKKKPAHTFTISDDAFHLDGEPFTLLSGEIHQFRIPRQYWRDRLRRVRALGFNSITVYVPWNFHQPDSPGEVDFSGDRDLFRFLDLAVQEDLFVVLRPPPYVCAEWDFGGMPAWLADPAAVAGGGTMPLRSSDRPDLFLAAVDRWYATLLPRIRPYLLENGGPVLMVQVDNEFGNGGEPDVPYLKSLAAMVRRHLDSEDVLLFTTDAPRFVSNGSVPFRKEGGYDDGFSSSSSSDPNFSSSSSDPNFFAMIDSGAGWNASDLDATFAPLRAINGPGRTPFFSSELYDGWVQFAGESFSVTNVSIARVAARMEGLLQKGKAAHGGRVGGGGLSLYMAAGGSNFGFSAGGSTNSDDDSFAAIIQSYDYAAPIAEGGSADRQPGYGGPPRASAVRAVLRKFAGETAKTPSYLSSGGVLAAAPPMPADPPVASYGRAELSQRATLLSALPQLASSPKPPLSAPAPLPMERFGQNRGFIAYSTRVPRSLLEKPGGALFEVGGGGAVHDLGTVLVDGVSQGTLDRGKGVGDGGSRLRLREVGGGNSSSSSSPSSSSFADLTVVVGMTGRSNQGMFDTKGLNGSVLIDGKELEGGEWTVWPLPLDDAARVEGVDLAAAAAVASSSSSSASSPLTVDKSGPLLLRGSFEVSAEQAEASAVGEVWEEEGEEGDEELGRKRRRSHPADTYLSFDGLSRGVAFVNGIALGWYDLVEGPQMRVFVPGVWLRKGRNDVLVLEMIGASADAAVETVREPDFYGPPKKEEEKSKKKSAAASSAAAASEFETSSMLRFPGAGSLRRIEPATTS